MELILINRNVANIINKEREIKTQVDENKKGNTAVSVIVNAWRAVLIS